MIKTLGYIIFVISCILWALIFIIPFLDFSKTQIAGILTGLIIAGEITFYLSIFLLGKGIISKTMNKLKIWKKKENQIQNQND